MEATGVARVPLAVEGVETKEVIDIGVGRAVGAAEATWAAKAAVQATQAKAAVAMEQESKRGSSQGGCTARG